MLYNRRCSEQRHVKKINIFFIYTQTSSTSSSDDQSFIMSEFRFMRVKALQRIKNRDENYFSTLSSISQMRIWVYENFYRWFSESLNLSRIQVTYNSWRFIDDKSSSHIQSSRNLTWITCNLACFINDVWA